MKSKRTAVTLIFVGRTEVSKGVWEDSETKKTVRAAKESIYQKRLDAAMLEGLTITARLRVRECEDIDTVKYAVFEGNRYKVNLVNPESDGHFAIIELGEMV